MMRGPPRGAPRTAIVGALVTLTLLIGGLVVGGVVGFLVFESLPGHSLTAPDAGHIALAALPAFIGFLAGSAVWGMWLGRLGGVAARRRMAIAGMLGFAPITLVVSIGLSMIEPFAIEAADTLPVHRVFTILFVPATSLVAGVSAAAIAAGLRRRGTAVRMTRDTGLAAGAAFLVVNLGMEAIGWVVGGPHAAARSTMITVMLVGLAAATLAGGAVLSLRVAASTRTA